MVYIHVAAGAEVESVAADLRNHGPTVLLVSCETSEVAKTLNEMLEEPPVTQMDAEPRGGGEKPAVAFYTVMRGQLIVCGRRGIVKGVVCTDDLHDGVGKTILLVAEICMRKHFCSFLKLPVAVAARDSDEPFEQDQLNGFRMALMAKDVRVFACNVHKLADFLHDMRKSMAIQVAAWNPWHQHAVVGSPKRYSPTPHYVFVVGPVDSVNALPQQTVLPANFTDSLEDSCSRRELREELTRTRPVVTGSDDETTGWPPLPTVKQKAVKTVFEDTFKMTLFCQGRKSRRTIAKRTERREKATRRWQNSVGDF